MFTLVHTTDKFSTQVTFENDHMPMLECVSVSVRSVCGIQSERGLNDEISSSSE